MHLEHHVGPGCCLGPRLAQAAQHHQESAPTRVPTKQTGTSVHSSEWRDENKSYVTERAPPLLSPRTLWVVLAPGGSSVRQREWSRSRHHKAAAEQNLSPEQTRAAPATLAASTLCEMGAEPASQVGTSTLIWPHFTWLNIENNYSNDDNWGLMTFTSSSSERRLLRVRASSNKWAVRRALGRRGLMGSSSALRAHGNFFI